MVRNRARNNLGRGNGQGRMRAAVRNEHLNNDGAKYRPPITPPQYVRLPWNDFTFSATYPTTDSTTNTISITAGSVRQQIVSRMGLGGTPGRIAFKIVSGAAWNVATANGFSEPYVRGLFYEVTPAATTYAFRSDQADHGTLQRAARVGYHYPLRDKKEILTSADDSYVLGTFSTVPNTASGNITVRYRVLWLCTNDGALLGYTAPDATPEEGGLVPLPI
jgi:hypothetical protein